MKLNLEATAIEQAVIRPLVFIFALLGPVQATFACGDEVKPPAIQNKNTFEIDKHCSIANDLTEVRHAGNYVTELKTSVYHLGLKLPYKYREIAFISPSNRFETLYCEIDFQNKIIIAWRSSYPPSRDVNHHSGLLIKVPITDGNIEPLVGLKTYYQSFSLCGGDLSLWQDIKLPYPKLQPFQD